jgi:hypothetical protein
MVHCQPESYCMARHLIASDKTIQKAAKEGVRRLSDGDGLYILFSVKGASHAWRYDYTFQGARKTLSLGTYPDTGLSLARAKADDIRKLLAEGWKPCAESKHGAPSKPHTGCVRCAGRCSGMASPQAGANATQPQTSAMPSSPSP